MITRYGCEFIRGTERVIFIIVIQESITLQVVQTAMEHDGWVLDRWTPINHTQI